MNAQSQNPQTSAGAQIRPQIRAQLWQSLNEVEQDEALAAFWESDDPNTRGIRRELVKFLAEALKFRPVFVERAEVSKKVGYLKKVLFRKPFCLYLDDFIRAWLIERRCPLLKAFLEGASIPQEEDGFVGTDEPPSVDQLECGITAVIGKFPARDINLYLNYLAHFGSNDGFWAGLANAPSFAKVLLADSQEQDAIHEDADSSDQAVPNAEGFTTLDNLLITRMIASAFGEEGAFGEDAMEDLVEEIVELNASRQRSLFHRGFFHALYGRPFAFHFPGENSERRQWYLCGVILGLLRRGEVERCVEILACSERDLGMELATSRNSGCGPMVFPNVCFPLLKAGHLGLALHFATHQLPRLPNANHRWRLFCEYIAHGSNLLRLGKSAEAEPIFDTMGELLIEHFDAFPDMLETGQKLIKRRKAQCLQAKGLFAAARSILNTFDMDDDDSEPYKALADLGLIDGGFRSLSAILPKPAPDQNVALLEALRRGRTNFERAIVVGGGKATNANFCLGVLQTIENSGSLTQSSADRFQTALGGMLEDEAAYSTNGILDWTRFLLALALLESAEPSNYLPAADLIPGAFNSGVRFPTFVWERMFEAATMFDDPSLAIQIAEYLLANRDEAIDCLLKNAQMLARRESLLATILERLHSRKMSIKKRWAHLVRLLPPALACLANDAAGSILDSLESIAVSNRELRKSFIDLLEDSDHYSPAWEAGDARESKINLLEMEGRKAEAAQLLREGFFQLRAGGEAQLSIPAQEIIERIRLLGVEPALSQDLSNLLKSLPKPAQLEPGLCGRVLYIGGNETQMSYRSRMEKELAAEHSSLRATFYFPGWDSNWNIHLEKLKPMIDHADVVVINTLVRTQLGRSLRAYCSSAHPWLPCTGRGYDSLKRSILHAAAWVQARGVA